MDDVLQSQSVQDVVDEDQQTQDEGDVEKPTRTRKLTEKGAAYQMETLQTSRSGAYSKMKKQINKLRELLNDDITLEDLEVERNSLDLIKEDVNQAHFKYENVLSSKDDKDSSYKWFDQRDREYQECRTRVTERIHALERQLQRLSSPSSIRSDYSKKSHRSKSSGRSGSSNSSARARRAKAAPKVARLGVERDFVDKESEMKKMQLAKEIAMANAEEVAMKKIVEEEASLVQPDQRINMSKYEDTELPCDIEKPKHFVQKRAIDEFELRINPVQKSYQNLSCFHEDTMSRFPENVQSNLRFKSATNARDVPGQSTKPRQAGVQTQAYKREGDGTYLADASIQDIVHLQAKQTELSAMIVEQQRLSTLPLQEPPIFDGNYFDYPIFIRAFETIIERRVLLDKDRLYFLNKYTTGKANEIIKVFITSNSELSYKKAKQLLAQRYGDHPHRVSDAYKARLREWPKIKDGNSIGFQEFSDFLCRCEETMKKMRYMDDLNSSEMLKMICGKIPIYSGVRWCRYAFDIKRNQERPVEFEDMVKFMREEAELVTDPVFSPDAMKTERKKDLEKERGKKRSHPYGVNSFNTGTSHESSKKDLPTETRLQSCAKCTKSHRLNDCEEFKKLDLKERHKFVRTAGLCYGCFGVGHRSRSCRKKLTCQECGKSHPTTLHYPFLNKEKSQGEQDNGNESEAQAIGNCANIRKHSSCSGITKAAIIPVWLRHKDNPKREVMVYALLDNASDSTFVKTSTLKELGIKGSEVKLDLFTMLGKQEISVQKIEGLVVSRMDRRVEIELPKSYSRDIIPFKEESDSHAGNYRSMATPKEDQRENISLSGRCMCWSSNRM